MKENQKGIYINLNAAPHSANKQKVFLASLESGSNIFRVSTDNFQKIPGSPIAYWAPSDLFDVHVHYVLHLCFVMYVGGKRATVKLMPRYIRAAYKKVSETNCYSNLCK